MTLPALARPEWLGLLALAIPILWLVRRRAAAGAVLVPHLPLLESVLSAGDRPRRGPSLVPVALLGALAATALSAAGPDRETAGRRDDGTGPVPRSRLALSPSKGGPAIPRSRGLAASAEVRGDAVVLYARAALPHGPRGEPGGPGRALALGEPALVSVPVPDGGGEVEVEATLPATPGLIRAPLVLAEPGGGGTPLAEAAAAVPAPRRALVATASGEVPRSLAAALAALPDLVSSADAVAAEDLAAAAEADGAPRSVLYVLWGLGPSAAPPGDSLVLSPPPGDPLLALSPSSAEASALRFRGDHPVSRGLPAAGLAFPFLPTAREPAAPWRPLLETDRGPAVLAGSPAPGRRVVAILGDPDASLSGTPVFPRLVRRALSWLAAARAAEGLALVREGDGPAPGDPGAAARVAALGLPDFPSWREGARGLRSLPPGARDVAPGLLLVVEPDPFGLLPALEPPPSAPASLAASPPRPEPVEGSRRVAESPPSPGLPLLALAALAAAAMPSRRFGPPEAPR
ncbi:MAG: hypothetical protein L0216_02885 [Planctomycetales bacterium]|nr:hypothetical protein [Planctomycetales bacterium]